MRLLHLVLLVGHLDDLCLHVFSLGLLAPLSCLSRLPRLSSPSMLPTFATLATLAGLRAIQPNSGPQTRGEQRKQQ